MATKNLSHVNADLEIDAEALNASIETLNALFEKAGVSMEDAAETMAAMQKASNEAMAGSMFVAKQSQGSPKGILKAAIHDIVKAAIVTNGDPEPSDAAVDVVVGVVEGYAPFIKVAFEKDFQAVSEMAWCHVPSEGDEPDVCIIAHPEMVKFAEMTQMGDELQTFIAIWSLPSELVMLIGTAAAVWWLVPHSGYLYSDENHALAAHAAHKIKIGVVMKDYGYATTSTHGLMMGTAANGEQLGEAIIESFEKTPIKVKLIEHVELGADRLLIDD